MKLSDKVYDTLKWIVTIVLPALSALYWGLSGIWGWLPLSLCMLALVVWKHRENIARLRAGTEKSWLKSKHKE